MDKDKKEKRLSDYDNTGQLGVTEMFGAIFFMLIGAMFKLFQYNMYFNKHTTYPYNSARICVICGK